jgi:2-dehydropantoate 2-reductase
MDQSQNPTYLIYGAGALGSVLGGFLQKIGRSVTYAGRGAHFQALQDHGLKITGIWGDHFIPPEEIIAHTNAESSLKRFSTILLCVKSKDTKTAASQAAPLLQEDGIMVSIQNGLNNWEAISQEVGEEHTVGARVIFGAEIPIAGQARVTVNADDVLLGEPFRPVNRILLQTLQEDLRRSGIPARTVGKDEIWAALWGKVLYNCSLNPLGAILEVPYGKLGDNEETRNIIRIIIKEIFLVCQGLGVTLPYRNADDYYRYLLETQLPPTTAHRASMLQDIQAGRETEIEALNGAISRYAEKLGISTPCNDLLTNLIRFREKPQNQGHGRPTGPEAS